MESSSQAREQGDERARALRVVVVAPHALMGGQESWLLQLLDATDRLRVTAILLQDGALRTAFEDRGIPVEVLPVGRRPVDLVKPMVKLAAKLRELRPDVVLANGIKAQIVVGPVARLMGLPLVFARHDHAFENLAGRVSRLADRVVGTSEEVLAAVDRQDAEVMYPPAPPPPLEPETARRGLSALGVPDSDDLVIGMLTRMVASKGIEDAIRALPAARRWRLVAIGADDPSDPGERQRLQQLAIDLEVADRVHLLGFAPEAPDLVAGLDAVGVFTRTGTSRAGGEGFGMVALEGMRAGVPVVAVEGGAIERRLQGQAGICVRDQSPADIAKALNRLDDAATRATMGAAGRELSAQHPDARATADRLVTLLAEAAKRPGAGLPADAPVSVVVPVYNEGAEAATVARALAPHLGPDDELIFVDDGSSDETVAELRSVEPEIPQLEVIVKHPNAGASAARNTGVAGARHELIICTDAGNEVPAGWLTSMRTALAESSAPDLVAGCYRVTAATAWEHAMKVSLFPDVDDVRQPNVFVRGYSRLFGRGFAPDRPSGRSLGFRRSAWTRVGGFREDLRTAEDTAFGLAVGRDGKCVLQTDAPVVWRQHQRWAATARMFTGYGRGDGQQGEAVVLLRNTCRAVAVIGTPLLLAAGGTRVRALVALAGAAYLSLPLWKLRHEPRGLQSAVLVPVALATKDVAKAFGCAQGVLEARRTRGGPGIS